MKVFLHTYSQFSEGVFIVTFIRVFAEFFQVVVVIPRWDHRL
ncbi:MAG: Uncharacterized protein XD43_0965, partial [Thermococcales archaeon 44_46]